MRADLPGLGRSSKSEGSDLEWLSELIKAQHKQTTLIAHSYASGLALRLAKRNPDMVHGLVLISPFFVQERAPWLLRMPAVASRILRSGTQEKLQARLTRLDAQQGIHDAVESAYGSLRRRSVARTAAKHLANASNLAERRELTQLLASAAHPVLIVHGEHDPIVSNHSAVSLVCIPEAGHTPHIDAPSQVAAAIEHWLSTAFLGTSRGAAPDNAPSVSSEHTGHVPTATSSR